MNKQTVTCINESCRALLQPTGTPYLKCGKCRTRFFSFCHQFPNTPNTYTQCSKCPNELYYFFCSKCKDVMCFKNYRMGDVSKCKCGFEGCYVICIHCNNQMCYPPGQRYEGLGWTCYKCEKPFSFLSCDECFKPIYTTKFKEQEKYRCGDNRCRAGLVVKKCIGCKSCYLDSKNNPFCGVCEKEMNNNGKLDALLWKKLSENSQNTKPRIFSPKKNQDVLTKREREKSREKQVPTPALDMPVKNVPVPKSPIQPAQTLRVPESKGREIEKSFGKQIQSLCKICLDKPAQFINIKCFHLSTCETCSTSMNRICPLCRAEGDFHRVYK